MQVKREIDLVYGGGSIGLMGQVAQTVDSGGGNVVGYVVESSILTAILYPFIFFQLSELTWDSAMKSSS